MEAVTRYAELEAQPPLGAPAAEQRQTVSDLCFSYDETRADLDHTSWRVAALRRWLDGKEEDLADGLGFMGAGFLGLAQTADTLAASIERLSSSVLSQGALIMEFGPRQWISRTDTRTLDRRMHVAHVLGLAGASVAQIAEELGTSIDTVKALNKRWKRGAWRHQAAVRYQALMDEEAAKLGWPPHRRPGVPLRRHKVRDPS